MKISRISVICVQTNTLKNIINNEKLLLWFIFSLGLLLRIAFIILWDRRLNYDTQNYIAQAEGIINGNPVSGFPNGYPLIIAVVIFLIGKNFIFPVMIFLNLIAQFFTGYFLYKITKLLFPQSSNNPREIQKNNHFTILILLLFAIYPSQIYFTNIVLTETITTLFITVSVYSLIINSYFTGGLTLALASMIRTSFLPALVITFLYILYTKFRSHQQKSAKIRVNQRENLFASIRENPRETSFAKIRENLRAERQSINHSFNHPIIQSPFTKYLAGLFIVLTIFALLDISSVTKFPNNQNYSLLLALNKNPSEATPDTKSNIQTYIDFATSNPKEFIFQRASSFWALWGVFPLEINNLFIRLIFSIRIFLFLSWVYWLYIFIRKKEQGLFRLYFIPLSIIMLTITIIHTIYFSSFRYIVPLEPVLLILLVFTIFRFFTVNQSITQSSNQSITQ